MNKWWKKVMQQWLPVLILFFTALQPLNAGEVEDLKEINRLIESTKRQLTSTTQQEKSVLSSLLASQQELARIERELETLEAKISTTQQGITRLEKELAACQQELDRLTRLLQSRKEKYNRRLTAAYKLGPMSYLEMLVAAENFSDLVSRFEMLAYFLRSDRRLMEEVSALQAKVASEQRAYQSKKRELEQERLSYTKLLRAAEQQRRQQAVLVKQTEEQLKRVQADRRSLERALDELEETSRRIEEELKRRQREEGALGTGTMIWPVQGRISSRFGLRFHPILKKNRFHSGIDITIPTGTPVKAADSGRVLMSQWNGGYGYFIALDHGNGLSTAYAHNSRLLVKEGEMVTKGQVIAYSGNTGLSTGPHLHFEVRVQGAPDDPMKYLP
ncbi:MAG: peptidoglycan DD-metalloendopeptidase family protein [Firmicutes bacterium]|nr:peptidoglycan DD-metalloendopeptidase family protein [Bacillota bacterium]